MILLSLERLQFERSLDRRALSERSECHPFGVASLSHDGSHV